MCGEIFDYLQDGGKYTFNLKSGLDGQSGRGSYAIKGKKVDENKRGADYLFRIRFLMILQL